MEVEQDVESFASRKRARDGHNNDPLVITMTIDQCLVKRILVDTGSSVNVLFKDTLMRMDIPWSRVMSYKVPIVGFTGKTIKLEGKVTLQVAIGDTRLNVWNKNLKKTKRYQSSNLKENLNDSPIVPKSLEDDTTTTWSLNVDGSTGEKYRGACFILEDLDKHQYAYAMKFSFPVTNNEAKYEALLAGLQMASSLKISHLCVRSDSKVLIGQVTCVLKPKRKT
ncbi:hypothetical protein M9H77_21169 [Catharanthus roseus]|uniref:Uncharacterized protein n=1 Tax=Catharanthus roseus TaxID=4058 RepID=A0ACC0AQU1_CATRO|nr:hypothetical protein M9H77_21169 [Catharanthus roseus]